MQNLPNPRRTRFFLNLVITCAFLSLLAPWVATAQQTVFYDTFGTSTLNQTNIAGGIPGGTASGVTPFSATSYTIGSAKDARGTSIGSGHFNLITANTSSGNLDAQALFTKYPISLVTLGDYIELTYTFNDTRGILQSDTSASGALFMGLFNSFGVAPQSGTAALALQNGGFTGGLTTANTGGTQGWVGYHSELYNISTSRIFTRPAQTGVDNNNQNLLFSSLITSPGGANGGGITSSSLNLVPGSAYTVQLRITLSAAGQLTASNAIYAGVDTTGTRLTNMIWLVTGANVLTTNFDSLAIGYRGGTPNAWTNDITNIKVVASLAAQAGPYFFCDFPVAILAQGRGDHWFERIGGNQQLSTL